MLQKLHILEVGRFWPAKSRAQGRNPTLHIAGKLQAQTESLIASLVYDGDF